MAKMGPLDTSKPLFWCVVVFLVISSWLTFTLDLNLKRVGDLKIGLP